MNVTEEIQEARTPKGSEIENAFKNLMKNIRETKESVDFSEVKTYKGTFENEDKSIDARIGSESIQTKKRNFSFKDIDSEGTNFLNDWKLKSVFPARITEVSKTAVILEVIIDEDTVEEQEYDNDFFEGFNLETTRFFKIKCYRRPREQRIVMTDASDYLKREDFPSVDFSHITNEDLFF